MVVNDVSADLDTPPRTDSLRSVGMVARHGLFIPWERRAVRNPGLWAGPRRELVVWFWLFPNGSMRLEVAWQADGKGDKHGGDTVIRRLRLALTRRQVKRIVDGVAAQLAEFPQAQADKVEAEAVAVLFEMFKSPDVGAGSAVHSKNQLALKFVDGRILVMQLSGAQRAYLEGNLVALLDAEELLTDLSRIARGELLAGPNSEVGRVSES